jgi:hypothetical protein
MNRRLVAAGVIAAALVALVIAFVVLRGAAQEPPRAGANSEPATPTQRATPSASPTQRESPSAAPSAPTGEDAVAILEQIEEQVLAIRGLEPPDIGPPDLITREELRDELQRIFDEEYPPGERERDNLALRAFGLLAPDEDVADLQLDLLGEGVLGFYDDTEKRMVVVTDAGLDPAAMVTYAHEYTHALQDANFGLDSLEIDVDGEDDRGLARTALQEGDANITMIAWLLRHLTTEQQMALLEMPVPDTTGIPSWMVAQLEFPYTIGEFFVSQLAGGDVLAPDFSAVNAAYADPPDSTEQVIHPDAWSPREEPVAVEVPDIAAELGEGWEEVDETPVGEATIAIILEHFGAPQADAGVAAEGWGGDRSVVATGPDGAFALAWRLTWDAARDAGQFVDAYEAVVEQLEFPASVRALEGGDVLVVHASSSEVHDAVVELSSE